MIVCIITDITYGCLRLHAGYVATVLPGITEAFVHAVLDPSALSAANAMLVVFTVAHVVTSVVMVKLGGAAGLVLADAFNMLLRIAYSLRCVSLHA